MRDGSPSLTAMIVAAARAAAGVDPIASRLAPAVLVRALGVTSFGLAPHLEVRTRAIDDAVESAMGGERSEGGRTGTRQLVILGAGLDARGWRLDALRDATVFEIDHPATQAFKKRRIGDVPERARAIRFVGVDFEKDDLAERLASAGHDASAPTMWIWEGVTPYLTAGAIEGTLAIIDRRSAPASVLAMTYGTPTLASVPRIIKRAVGPAFRILGEPLRGLMTVVRAHELVRACGFEVVRDESIAELARRFAVRGPWHDIAEQVLVARRAT